MKATFELTFDEGTQKDIFVYWAKGMNIGVREIPDEPVISKKWTEDDIAAIMNENGIVPTREAINLVLNDDELIETLTACDDSEWNAIEAAIKRLV